MKRRHAIGIGILLAVSYGIGLWRGNTHGYQKGSEDMQTKIKIQLEFMLGPTQKGEEAEIHVFRRYNDDTSIVLEDICIPKRTIDQIIDGEGIELWDYYFKRSRTYFHLPPRDTTWDYASPKKDTLKNREYSI